jgi:hypothetical protein
MFSTMAFAKPLVDVSVAPCIRRSKSYVTRFCAMAFSRLDDDEVRGLVPAHVAEHHLAREDHRAGIHLVLVGVLRRGAVGRLEDGVARLVVDVRRRRDADAADLRARARRRCSRR